MQLGKFSDLLGNSKTRVSKVLQLLALKSSILYTCSIFLLFFANPETVENSEYRRNMLKFQYLRLRVSGTAKSKKVHQSPRRWG